MTTAATVTRTLGSSSFPPAGSDRSLLPFWVEIDVATTDLDNAGDEIVVGTPFPTVAYFPNAAGMFTAYATNIAAADLDVTVGFGTSAGVLTYTLLTITDFGAGAATCDSMAVSLDAEPAWIDIGGLYLVVDCTVPATTPAVGQIQIAGFYSQNILKNEE